MKRNNYFLILLVVFFSTNSCRTKELRSFLVGSWVIKNVIIDQQHYEKGRGLLSVNVFDFNENGECRVPRLIYKDTPPPGKWSLKDVNGQFYLNISDCTENLYNHNYLIKIVQENPKVIKLISSEITFECNFINMIH